MNNELQVVETLNQDLVTYPQPVFTQNGGNGVQFVNQDNGTVNLNFHNYGAAPQLFNASTPLSNDFYNLFIIGKQPLTEYSVLVPLDRALTSDAGVPAEITREFGSLTPEIIARIKTFPSIFTNENHEFGKTSPDHQAYFGMVTDVRIQENGVRIYFHPFCTINQQQLNDHLFDLGIGGSSTFNEFNRTKWTIKRMPLVDELIRLGIIQVMPSFISGGAN